MTSPTLLIAAQVQMRKQGGRVARRAPRSRERLAGCRATHLLAGRPCLFLRLLLLVPNPANVQTSTALPADSCFLQSEEMAALGIGGRRELTALSGIPQRTASTVRHPVGPSVETEQGEGAVRSCKPAGASSAEHSRSALTYASHGGGAEGHSECMSYSCVVLYNILSALLTRF